MTLDELLKLYDVDIPGASLTYGKQFRLHMRADDYEEDEELFRFYWRTACEETFNALQREALPDKYLNTFIHAVQLLAAHMHNMREAVSGQNVKSIPLGYEHAVKQMRHFRVVEEASDV